MVEYARLQHATNSVTGTLCGLCMKSYISLQPRLLTSLLTLVLLGIQEKRLEEVPFLKKEEQVGLSS